MLLSKADIISKLKKEILPLQGFKQTGNSIDIDPGLGPILEAFPNKTFPRGAVHEFLTDTRESIAVTTAFISGILTAFMRSRGTVLWISSSQIIYPPGLPLFGVEPDRIIFINLEREQDRYWVMEEALKCESLVAVVAEVNDLSFAVSRRLQLVVEQSRVTGFILRTSQRPPSTTACISRWKITSVPGISPDELPGLGFPRWNVALLKARNGKPGNWLLEWRGGDFIHIQEKPALQLDEIIKKKQYA